MRISSVYFSVSLSPSAHEGKRSFTPLDTKEKKLQPFLPPSFSSNAKRRHIKPHTGRKLTVFGIKLADKGLIAIQFRF